MTDRQRKGTEQEQNQTSYLMVGCNLWVNYFLCVILKSTGFNIHQQALTYLRRASYAFSMLQQVVASS